MKKWLKTTLKPGSAQCSLLLLISFGLIVAACSPKSDLPPEEPDTARAEPMSESIELDNLSDESDCSPKVEDDFRGLVISVPDAVTLKDESQFLVCGTYQVDESVFIQFRSFENEIVIHVTDLTRHVPYSSSLLDKNFEPEYLDDFEPDEDVEDVVITGWFSADLYDYFPDLPRRPGLFSIYATIGDMKSNVIKVEVVK